MSGFGELRLKSLAGRSDPVATVDGCAYERDYIERPGGSAIALAKYRQKQCSDETIVTLGLQFHVITWIWLDMGAG